VALLTLAVLTKQTAVVFLLAATLAAALAGQRRWALLIPASAAGGLLLIVAAVTLGPEPHFAESLIAERIMPWSFPTWRLVLRRIALASPELLVLPTIGLGLWLRPGGHDGASPRAVRPAVLAVSLLAAALGLSVKLGADINYYLNLRIAAALGAGALWHAAQFHERGHKETTGAAQHFALRPAPLVATALLALVALIPSVLNAIQNVDMASAEAAFYQSPDGQALLHSYRRATALAANPRRRVLTDTGLVDLYQGERAAYGDPWLFRVLVETGHLRPTVMAERIHSRYYDVFISDHDLDSPDYGRHDFRLPTGLFECVRANYVIKESLPGLLMYRRRAQPRAHGGCKEGVPRQ
jgi:hypothetical protein